MEQSKLTRAEKKARKKLKVAALTDVYVHIFSKKITKKEGDIVDKELLQKGLDEVFFTIRRNRKKNPQEANLHRDAGSRFIDMLVETIKRVYPETYITMGVKKMDALQVDLHKQLELL